MVKPETEETIAAIVRTRAAADPAGIALRFLSPLSGADTGLSLGQLDRSAGSVAAALAGLEPQSPVLLAFPTGPDFVAAYLGCLHAGMIAVPVRYPNARRPLTHIRAVAADSGAACVLTTGEMRALLEGALGIAAFAVADLPAAPAGWAGPEIAGEDVAHLQYTSGSTAAPKGVMIGHRALIANVRDILRCWEIDADSRTLSWLPLYHDLGLVFGCVAPLVAGCPGMLMSPTDFSRSPAVWLEAVSRHRITHTAAPNFAFDACLAIPEARRLGLDLSSLRVATNGAEPVRAHTVRAFAETYGPLGFAAEAMCPGYGLAEVTLMASLCGPGELPAIVDELVASSGAPTSTRIAIVDPETYRRCKAGERGEIWLAGPSVAAGYWRRPEASAAKFAARIAGGRSAETWLRTGDLGFLKGGRLFVLGRMDDLIIVRGVNHHAEDIELSVERCDPALAPGGGAAFAEEQGLVIAQEVRREALRTLDVTALLQAIRRTVSEQHELSVSAILLLRPGGLPRTHSGKKQRHACRSGFADDTLEPLARWDAKVAATPAQEEQVPDRVDALNAWLRDYAVERLDSRLMDERRSIPPYVVLDLGNRGVLGMVAPRAHGGMEISNRELVRIVQQLAAIDTTIASFVLVNNALGIRPIVRHAQPATREALLPALAAGRELAAFAMTEADAGSNIRNLASVGRPDGEGWRLWGTKLWSGSAAWAGVINTFVRVEGEHGAQSVAGFVLRQGSQGLRHGPEALTMGLRAMVQNQVLLEGVRVTAADRLGEAGDGMAAATDTMAFGRFAIGAMSVGILKRCLQLMVRHGTRRTIATGRLIDNPATRMRVSDLAAATHAVEALVETVADLLDADTAIPPELFCACKTAGPEFAWRAADGLVQQLAGRGYIETNLAPQILRDTRVLRIFEGPTEPMHMHVGSRLVRMPEALCGFVREALGEGGIADALTQAAQAIVAHALAHADALGGPNAARQWAYLEAGEVATYGLLRACVRHRARAAPSAALDRAEQWAARRFDRRLARALGVPSVLLDARDSEALVADFALAIGDIEQRASGEERGLDPLLRVTATQTEAAEPIAASEEEGPLYPELLDWLRNWLTAEYGDARDRIAATARFSDFGMDSVAATLLAGGLEARLGTALPSTLIWEHPTLGGLAHYLAGRGAAPKDDALSLLARIDELSEAELEALAGSYAPDRAEAADAR
ncbi:AMP-binding protein [Sphingomonas sp. MMS12-HWE2-04]|uniref:AMP-binding protein n=1 Tax=Sphingomonas sp. MMS12-HWE2-04 TaxID=3234199 RepID=UPI00384B0636